MLSPEAFEIFDAMGYGMILLEHRGKKECKLVYNPKLKEHLENSFREINVEWEVFDELYKSGRITELNEYTERWKGGGGKIGWREFGLPGEEFRVFACTQ